MVGPLVGCFGGAGTLRTQGMVLPQLVGWAQKVVARQYSLSGHPVWGKRVLVERVRELSRGEQRNKKT